MDAGVRYWQDAYINGNRDIDCDETVGCPNMPCAEYTEGHHRLLRANDWRWRPLIDIETGKIVNWEKGTTANVHYKVCDDFQCDILDADKDVIESYNGYVPNIMSPKENGYGDYIIMDINENGFIQGWNKELIFKLIKQEEN